MSFPVIALWSHPRSMSTAFERIMRGRGDLECLHEPFMYDYYINRSKRQMPHFDAEDDHPRSYEAIRAMILAKAEKGPVFFKDMSYYVIPHMLADTEFVERVRHSFLIRDPKASLVSYAKLDPDLTLEEVGLEAQWKHLEALMARGAAPVVVQSEAVQADPHGQMRKYWAAVGLDDKPQALEWSEDVPQDWQQVSGWHEQAMSSKTIRPISMEQRRETEAKFEALIVKQPHMMGFLGHHMPYYERLLHLAIK